MIDSIKLVFDIVRIEGRKSKIFWRKIKFISCLNMMRDQILFSIIFIDPTLLLRCSSMDFLNFWESLTSSNFFRDFQ